MYDKIQKKKKRNLNNNTNYNIENYEKFKKKL